MPRGIFALSVVCLVLAVVALFTGPDVGARLDFMRDAGNPDVPGTRKNVVHLGLSVAVWMTGPCVSRRQFGDPHREV